MASRAKYLTFDGLSTLAVVFTGTVNHADVAKAIEEKLGCKGKSAGAVTFYQGEDGEVYPSCVPGSVSLGIPMNPEKAEEDNTTLFYFLTKS